jgi:hypothetical protein
VPSAIKQLVPTSGGVLSAIKHGGQAYVEQLESQLAQTERQARTAAIVVKAVRKP